MRLDGGALMPQQARRAAPLLARAAVLAPMALALPSLALAQDAKLGRQKAQPCTVCHGANGLSQQPDAPNLAGQPAFYLSTQLRAFRNGERRHEVMAVMAKALSEEDIGHLAAWFSSIRIEVHLPR
jgi:cytochrome c553